MNPDYLITQLISLGFNAREAKLYYSLLQVPESSASELHRMSGVPRTKVYEALERMVADGFCIERVEGRNKYYRAVKPSNIHAELLKRWEEESAERVKTAEDLFEQLSAMFRNKESEDRSLDFIEVIRNKVQISRRYIALVNDSEDEILSFVRPPFASADPKNSREQDDAEHASLVRGVRQRSVYMVDEDSLAWMSDSMDELAQAGEEARLIDNLPIKMFIFDRRKTLLALPSIPGYTGSDFTMIVIEDPDFARACCILFELYWDKAYTSEQWGSRNNHS